MSFLLELHARVRDWEDAERAAAATASAGHVQVVVGRRERWGRTLTPSIHFYWQQAQDVLSDDADWDHDAFALSDSGCRDLAATVLALADVLEPGWGIRACWVGDDLKSERAMSAHDLAELVRQSQLDRDTLYRIT